MLSNTCLCRLINSTGILMKSTKSLSYPSL